MAQRAATLAHLGLSVEPSFWLDRPVLVTGASGLLGSWLVRRLLAERADIVALVRDWTPRGELIRSGAISRTIVVRGDVRDRPLLERTMGEYEIDTVFHLAAQTLVPVANRNPVSTFETNVAGTWSVLEACRRTPTVRQVVVASSDKAYGDAGGAAYRESMPLAGRHPYDASKSAADLVATSYACTFGLPVAVTRCGNFFGGGDLNWSRIVPGTIRSLLRARRPVVRSDGSLVRDYLYVEDAAAAYLLLAERLAADPGLIGEAFNFSYERPLSVLEMVELVLKVTGSDLRPRVLAEAQHEIPCQRLDATKARLRLGWRPKFEIEAGLRLTLDWYRTYLADAGGDG